MMKRNQSVIPLLVFLLVFSTSTIAVGEADVLQPGPEEGIDTFIINIPAGPFGDSLAMFTVLNNVDVYDGIYILSLVKFDLPPSLNAEDIDSAQLELYAYFAAYPPGTTGTTVNVHRVLQPWEESSVWSDFPSLTNYPTSQNLFDYNVESSFFATGSGWMSFDVTNLVKDWISNPSFNYGVLLETPYSEVPSGESKQVGIYTSDWFNNSGEDEYRPKLIINYSETVPATIDFHPDTLNVKSKGKWVTCYIELPEGNDLDDIETIAIVSIAMNGGGTSATDIPAEDCPREVGDYDSDDIPDLMVKFDRQSIQDDASAGVSEITVSCKTYSGTTYEGSDTVLTIHKGQEH